MAFAVPTKRRERCFIPVIMHYSVVYYIWDVWIWDSLHGKRSLDTFKPRNFSSVEAPSSLLTVSCINCAHMHMQLKVILQKLSHTYLASGYCFNIKFRMLVLIIADIASSRNGKYEYCAVFITDPPNITLTPSDGYILSKRGSGQTRPDELKFECEAILDLKVADAFVYWRTNHTKLRDRKIDRTEPNLPGIEVRVIRGTVHLKQIAIYRCNI